MKIEKENLVQIKNPKTKKWTLIDTEKGVILEERKQKYKGVKVK